MLYTSDLYLLLRDQNPFGGKVSRGELLLFWHSLRRKSPGVHNMNDVNTHQGGGGRKILPGFFQNLGRHVHIVEFRSDNDGTLGVE